MTERDRPAVGVLFAHGIGRQRRGQTLIGWAESLQAWIQAWSEGAGGTGGFSAEVGDAVLRVDPTDPSAPAHLRLDVIGADRDGRDRRVEWLLAESEWSEAFAAPRYVDFARWGLWVVPWTLISHFGIRLKRAWERMQTVSSLPALGWETLRSLTEFVYLVVAVALAPVLVLLIVVLLLIAIVPIGQVRNVAAALQRAISATLGDSQVLLNSPVQAAAIVSHVRRDLAWLRARCRRVAVVAHSQGAAIAHRAMSEAGRDEPGLLITFGSGLNKVRSVEGVGRSHSRWLAWLPILGLSATLASVMFADTRRRAWVLAVGILTLLVLSVLGGLVQRTGRAERLPKWRLRLGIGMTLAGALAWMGALGIFFAQAGYIGILGLGGAFAVAVGVRRVLEEEPDIRMDEGIAERWIDVWAGADPVPNGPLRSASKVGPRDEQVQNLGSWFRDHTTYWKNRDHFHPLLVTELAELSGLTLDGAEHWQRRRLDVAKSRRAWRVGWLMAARLSALLALATLPWAVWSEYPALGQDAISAVDWTAERLPFLEPLVENNVSPRTAATFAMLLAVVSGYALAVAVWHWWNAADVRLLYRRRHYPRFTFGSVVFFVVWAAATELAVVAAVGWADEWILAFRGGFSMVLLGAGAYVVWVVLRYWSGQSDTREYEIARGAFRAGISLIVAAPIFLGAAATWRTDTEVVPAIVNDEVAARALGVVVVVALAVGAVVLLSRRWSAMGRAMKSAVRRLDGCASVGPIVVASVRKLPEGHPDRLRIPRVRINELEAESKELEAMAASNPDLLEQLERLQAEMSDITEFLAAELAVATAAEGTGSPTQ